MNTRLEAISTMLEIDRETYYKIQTMYHVLLKNSQFAISLFKVNEFLKLLIQAIEEAIVLGI